MMCFHTCSNRGKLCCYWLVYLYWKLFSRCGIKVVHFSTLFRGLNRKRFLRSKHLLEMPLWLPFLSFSFQTLKRDLKSKHNCVLPINVQQPVIFHFISIPARVLKRDLVNPQRDSNSPHQWLKDIWISNDVRTSWDGIMVESRRKTFGDLGAIRTVCPSQICTRHSLENYVFYNCS